MIPPPFPPSSFSGPPTGWNFEATSLTYPQYGGSKVRVAIPIGGIVIFWAAVWISWMIIAERRELLRYSKKLESGEG